MCGPDAFVREEAVLMLVCKVSSYHLATAQCGLVHLSFKDTPLPILFQIQAPVVNAFNDIFDL